MTTNLVPISSDGGFVTAGNITTASYASPAPTISGFSSVSATMFTNGNSNVTVNSNANVILSAPASFNICTITASGSGYDTGSSLKATTGGSGTGMTVGIGYGLSTQLTSVTVVDPGTGYVNGDVITVSDGTGGTFAISKYNESANQTNNNTVQSNFIFINNTLTLPTYGEVIVPGNVTTGGLLTLGNISTISIPQVGSALDIATNDQGGLGGYNSQALSVTYNADILSTFAVGDTITWQDNTIATITGFDNYGPSYIDIFWDTPKTGTLFPITLKTDNYAPATYPNANIIVGNNTWTFNNTGNLTLPGNLIAATASPAPSIRGFNSVSALAFTNGTSNVTINANSNLWNFDSTGNLIIPGSSGGMIKTVANGAIGITAINNGSDNPAQLMSWTVGETNPDTIVSTYSSNALIQSNVNGTIHAWKFDNAGNLTLPANTFAVNYANGAQVSLSASSSNISNGNSNVTIATSAGNVVTNVNGSAILTTYSGGIKVGGSGVLQSPGGASAMTLNNNGANIPIANITNTLNVTGAGGANITANLTAGNISTGGTLTSTGKIGYASGSTVTQTTSRGNGVTINALAGTIITTSIAMVANEIDTFSVINSSVDPNNDIVLAQIVSPNQGTYNCIANPAVIGGFSNGFVLSIQNISGFTTSDEAITIRFMVIKAPNA